MGQQQQQSVVEYLLKHLHEIGFRLMCEEEDAKWKKQEINIILHAAMELEKDNIITAINEVSKRNIKYANNIISSFTKIEGELFMHDDKQAIEYYNKAYKK